MKYRFTPRDRMGAPNIVNGSCALVASACPAGNAHPDNNQRFNEVLNSCQNPRAIYNALLALLGPNVEDAG